MKNAKHSLAAARVMLPEVGSNNDTATVRVIVISSHSPAFHEGMAPKRILVMPILLMINHILTIKKKKRSEH